MLGFQILRFIFFITTYNGDFPLDQLIPLGRLLKIYSRTSSSTVKRSISLVVRLVDKKRIILGYLRRNFSMTILSRHIKTTYNGDFPLDQLIPLGRLLKIYSRTSVFSISIANDKGLLLQLQSPFIMLVDRILLQQE
ncbi:hypothetical protein CICLE_v10023349mg [Citrus x clementina]|uniref:Uncharacterized protein n=1 Tax=Citrus clementina TaxID=85681 RepID=V4VSK5_CITCL|nr:hypothetical protein CICLE_v10023349mg [Citrus x clementina]